MNHPFKSALPPPPSASDRPLLHERKQEDAGTPPHGGNCNCRAKAVCTIIAVEEAA